MTTFKVVPAAALVAFLLAGCSSAPPKPAAKAEQVTTPGSNPVEVGQKAPAFKLTDSSGASATLADYEGKILLLNFWATWCIPCKEEIPWFQEFDKKYKDRGFAVLGVSLDNDGWEAVKPYIKERSISYRMVVGNDEVSSLYGGVATLPTTFIVDRDGKVAIIHSGLESKATYQKEIERLLEKSLLEKKSAHTSVAGSQYAFFRAPLVRPE